MTKPNQIVTDVNDYNFQVSDQGNAAGICKQFAASQPAQLDPLVNTLNDVYRMARDTMGPAIESIKADLQDAWAGDDADKALAVIGDFTKNADELRDNSFKIANSLNTFRSDLTSLKAQASELDSSGFSGNNDNEDAKNLYDNFVLAKNNSLDSMPNALNYWTPLGAGGGQQQYDNQTPGPGGPGPGPGSIPGGPGSIPGGPGTIDPGPGTIPGPSLPPGSPGPTYGPGPVSGPGYGPGYGPGATYGPGPGDFGSGSGYGPGVGLDTGSSLAGAGGGPGPGVGGGGAGLGGGSGLPGSGSGLEGGGSGPAGGGAAGAGGALAGGGGAGAGAGGGAAGGRGMMMPMQGGQQGGDEERERTTWLDEDDDVWGGGDAPSGVIS